MAVARWNAAAVPVAGGMVAAGMLKVDLFDEASGRWLPLPHPMAQPRTLSTAQLVSMPASALLAS